MNKKDIIKELTEKFGFNESELKNKKVAELRKLLKDKRKEIDLDKEKDLSKKQDNESRTVSEIQLNVHEIMVRKFDPSKNVVVQNLGAGDVYVNKNKKYLASKDSLLKPNESKEFKATDVLYITASSRPIVRFVYKN